ncbi:MAG: serine/threonine-protein kinase [Gemmatimonadota bacterium]|nr:MAG: serine/threonine-protein kinase [Gemmatimonadota bacterium]
MTDQLDRLVAALRDRYRIGRQLGVGGMATVYLAHDLRHDRNVALKVLRPELAAVLGAERFVQEIKTTANLQHPHILALFDSGEADGFLYYVMPFIDGETLRDRLNRETQLGIEEAVRIACDVADGLDYAHRQGVIHRDIKPENILLHDGRPVVADFGIALAVSAASGGRMTETGLSLGTPHYMSPEQATAEKELSNRSDIYSLGSVLYEMLTGDPPHTGSTAQAIIMKIVTDDARPLAQLRKSVPPHVAAATAKALERLPADRFESAASFAAALQDSRAMSLEAIATYAGKTDRPVSSGWEHTRWALIIGSMVASAAVGWLLRPVPDVPVMPVTRFTVPVPQGHEMSRENAGPNLALSPDGRSLVYFVGDTLYRRSLNRSNPEEVGAAPGGCCPEFSRDGQWVYFAEDMREELRGISIEGGPIVDMTTRLRSQDLVSGSVTFSGILRRQAGDSAWEQITTLDTIGREGSHLWPQLLPGGNHVLYTALGPSMMWHGSRVVVEEVGSGVRTTVAEDATFGRYLPTGHVIYVDADGTLQAVRFDFKNRTVSGTPFVLEWGVRTGYWGGAASIAISDAGTLAFVRGSSWENHQLTWLDRAGAVLGYVGRPATVEGVQLSPDGRFAVTYVASNNSDIARFDVTSGEERRLTFGVETEDNPVWSHDGRRIAYHVVVSGRDHRIYSRDVEGQGEPQLLYSADGYAAPRSWSADGNALALFQHESLLVLNLADQSVDTVTTEAGVEGGRFSPDGRWLAYPSDETGDYEVYVVSYPGLSARQQVSVNGGRYPEWTGQSGELFFVNADTVMVSDVGTGDNFTRSVPRALFVSPGFTHGLLGYAVSADGQRILYPARNPDAPAREIHVVLNWFEELRRMEGVGR